MHKLTAALLAGFEATKGVSVRIAARIHAALIAIHVANLRKLIERADKRVRQYDDLIHYHKAAGIEAESRADEAARAADAVKRTALIEALSHGASL
ncbi:hypothetical protein [Burkholderia cenocepacia]|uniref:hypothetical protein n=1 Tax=Burkholderia cenocepacia TaxID=95486 RepID=UPI00097BEEB4|nr:hypothetical protein [Burkholderia cenocepacia]AQQ19846.1 hypothetical protein A8D61_15840 [Burkholderia cenocepacia]ONJ19593.1 hypothetical protein A8D82_11785 [Burkholderia cenocepacia]ONN83427.1 hypothetical protein A8D63_25980 [Burkholderia cenocepacia]ONN85908.1 hypothetical protein A8D64_19350 [Burkholderia cenocepacia]ONN95050.1 hypothetical protein A8D62_09715 [Burkholderia cenocepacia]